MTQSDRPWSALLAMSQADLEARWERLREWTRQQFGRELTAESGLFLVGLQHRGTGMPDRLEKEQKQTLIMEGTWVVFEAAGLSRRRSPGAEWERTGDWSVLSSDEQDRVVRAALVQYFESVTHPPE